MENRLDDPRHIKWARAVKKRDDFSCVICGIQSTYLNSHHCNSWDWCIEQRFSVDNGVTLCQRDHDLFHSIYGSGNNTVRQFVEFKKISQIIKSIIRENKKTIGS